MKFPALIPVAGILILLSVACHTIDDDRIPNMPVNIAIADAGMWNIYGVSGFGSNRNFIISSGSEREPAGFPYNSKSATGFGGVLLIEGIDPFTAVSAVPLAYDLACPVERLPEVRVVVNPETYFAECPVCGSCFDVTLGAGAPVSGMAATGKYKYGLKQYSCVPSQAGGYYITN